MASPKDAVAAAVARAQEVWQLQRHFDAVEAELQENKAESEKLAVRLIAARDRVHKLSVRKSTLLHSRTTQANAVSLEFTGFDEWKERMEQSQRELRIQEKQVKQLRQNIQEQNNYMTGLVDGAVNTERERLRFIAAAGAHKRDEARKKHDKDMVRLKERRDRLKLELQAEVGRLRRTRRRVAGTRCNRAIFAWKHETRTAALAAELEQKLREEAAALAREQRETRERLVEQEEILASQLRRKALEQQERIEVLTVPIRQLRGQIEASQQAIRSAEAHIKRRTVLTESVELPSEGDRVRAMAEAAGASDARRAAMRRAELQIAAQGTRAGWGPGARAARRGPWKSCGLTGELFALDQLMDAIPGAVAEEDEAETETLFASLESISPEEFLASIGREDGKAGKA